MKIGLIQEARPSDEPWSAAWSNSIEAVKKANPDVSVTETFNAYDATRAEPVIRQMLDGGAKVMLMSTFVLADASKAVAKDYPKVPMLVTAFGVTQKPNLNAGTASYLEIGYSTCWLLTKQSPDGRIGLVDAQGAPFEVEIEEGCALGAKAANPNYKFVKVSTNSFTDVQANREQVQSLLDQGIKQIYLVSGTGDAIGGLRLCETAKAQCATWGGDAKQWAPTGTLLTVNLNWKVVIDELTKQAKSGLKNPQTFDLTYGSKGLEALDYDSNPVVSDAVKTEFKQVLADLASEKIQLPDSKAHPGFR
ncbi:MAG: hypothetical protein JWO46_2472 [Nocardioidaceae bacterium]|nr:hypothetical protein [Nocardioidaceae bacterium]